MTNLQIAMDPQLVKARRLAAEYWELQPAEGRRPKKITRAMKIAYSKQLEILQEIATLDLGDAMEFVLLYRGVMTP